MKNAIQYPMNFGNLPAINQPHANPLVRKLKINGKSVKKPFCISPEMKEALEDLKERAFIPQPFSSIDHLWRELDIPAPKPAKHCWWRLTNCVAGAIIGIPSFCGRLVASDGISCCIIRVDGSAVFGHVAYFDPVEKLEIQIQDFDSYEGKRVRIPKATRKVQQPKVDISEFV